MHSPSLYDGQVMTNVRHSKFTRSATLRHAKQILFVLRRYAQEAKTVHPDDTNKQAWYCFNERQVCWDMLRSLIHSRLVSDASLLGVTIDGILYPCN